MMVVTTFLLFFHVSNGLSKVKTSKEVTLAHNTAMMEILIRCLNSNGLVVIKMILQLA